MKQLITGYPLATLLISACQPIHRPTSGKGSDGFPNLAIVPDPFPEVYL